MIANSSPNGRNRKSRSNHGNSSSQELVIARLDRIEESLRQLAQQRIEQDYYSTADVARLLGKAEFTVREWCRLDRIVAEKRPCGRGNSREWMVSHEELARIQSEGLLPVEPI